MDILEAVKARALLTVVKPETDNEYFARYVRRWYSRTFHTPLHDVEKLPMLDLFEHYYEVTFEEMEYEERMNAIGNLLMTEEEKRSVSLEEASDDVGARELLEQIAKENQIAPVEQVTPNSIKESNLPNVKTELPPNIELRFVPESDLDLDGFGTFAPPIKQQS